MSSKKLKRKEKEIRTLLVNKNRTLISKKEKEVVNEPSVTEKNKEKKQSKWESWFSRHNRLKSTLDKEKWESWFSLHKKDKNHEPTINYKDIEYSIDFYKKLITLLRESNPNGYDKGLDYRLHFYCYGGEEGIQQMITNGDIITELEAERKLHNYICKSN